jgi:hypothetical protein
VIATKMASMVTSLAIKQLHKEFVGEASKLTTEAVIAQTFAHLELQLAQTTTLTSVTGLLQDIE